MPGFTAISVGMEYPMTDGTRKELGPKIRKIFGPP